MTSLKGLKQCISYFIQNMSVPLIQWFVPHCNLAVNTGVWHTYCIFGPGARGGLITDQDIFVRQGFTNELINTAVGVREKANRQNDPPKVILVFFGCAIVRH